MRLNKSGTVSISVRDIDNFAARWPCCEIPRKPFWVGWDCNGNLVEIEGLGDYDGYDLKCLIEDAEEYAHKKKTEV